MIPLGVAAGVQLEEYARKNGLIEVIELNIANLGDVPSIVDGLIALGLFVYQFQFGQCILSVGLTLAFLKQLQAVIADHKQLREEHHGALTQIINTQNETTLKLAVCIDRNTAALQECANELHRIRERN